MPCQDRANETISCLPVTSLAIRMAASFDSAPVVSSSAFSSGSGSVSARRRARSTTGRLSMPLNRWSSLAACRVTVATISGCEWPRIALIWPEVKSRISAAVLGEQEASGGVVDDLAGERAGAGVADEVPVGVSPEGAVGRKRGGGRSGHGSDGTSGPGDPSISPHPTPESANSPHHLHLVSEWSPHDSGTV